MERRKVVITGMGTVNPLALSVEETWQRLIRGESGIDRIRSFDPAEILGLDVLIAGEVKNFDPRNYMDGKEAKRMDLFSQFAVAAAREAITQAGLTLSEDMRDHAGTFIGTGIGGIQTIAEQVLTLQEKGARQVSPYTVIKMMPNAACGNVSRQFGLRGLSFAPTSACSAGADALGYALMTLETDEEIDVMIAGGAEASIVPIGIASFQVIKALCSKFKDEPQKASRPFDAQRAGFVMGQGAAILVLEIKEHAQKRGANILAEFAGYGATSDAFHMTEPDEHGEGALKAMHKALKRANVGLDEVEYINAHGTSTPLNDRIETFAIKRLFGQRAYKIPISSTKGSTAHLVGAGGPLEAIFCVKQLETGWAPPTINYEFPDPECDLDYIPNFAREIGRGPVMSNSFGFGGHNSCLIFKPYHS